MARQIVNILAYFCRRRKCYGGVADVTGGQCQKWVLWEILYLIDVSQETICCGIVSVCGHVFIHFNLSNTTLTKENDSVFLLSNTLTYTPAEV